MPRKPRVEYEGAAYHVMCRGDHGEPICQDELLGKQQRSSYNGPALQDHQRRTSAELLAAGLEPGDCPDFRVNENGTVPFAGVYRGDRSFDTRICTAPKPRDWIRKSLPPRPRPTPASRQRLGCCVRTPPSAIDG